VRQEKDEYRIQELKNEMIRLDKALTVERMVCMSVYIICSLPLFPYTLSSHIYPQDERITNMEMSFEDEKRRILKFIEDRGKELADLLFKFKAEFDEDWSLRQDREAKLVEQLGAHEGEVDWQFGSQIAAREARYLAVKEVLQDNVKLRDRMEGRFSAFFDRELARLKAEFCLEKEMRDREDDDIMEALNRYTLKLQTSLQVVNSTDM
ncbi:SF-assemblin/beta giardin-domain-containing protein, partial [Ochromonadaceae sp. CCMP2298]